MDVAVGDIVLCEFYFSNLKQSKRRPVLVFKDNLPFDDFIGLPMSSKIDRLYDDEWLVTKGMLESGALPVDSKLMLRKPFVVSKGNPIKCYESLGKAEMSRIKQRYCAYFECP